MRNINISSFKYTPYQFVYKMLNEPSDGKMELSIDAIILHEEGTRDDIQIDIEAYKISFTDFVTLRVAEEETYYEESVGCDFSNYLTFR
ncbi:hypothetical protein [Terribacillus sp. JSM ZJ617]|uniref:hypothetical protein n=1 Tax=Terribacillus sp. JSM ZJ617 TaxID=3342119 RepID=UPI0035A8AD36